MAFKRRNHSSKKERMSGETVSKTVSKFFEPEEGSVFSVLGKAFGKAKDYANSSKEVRKLEDDQSDDTSS